jgi:thiamine pyrophosphokinase
MLCVNNNRAYIFTNHAPQDIVSRYQNIQRKDHLIAVDNGIKKIDELGLEPFVLIGDLDSIEPEMLEKYAYIPFHKHPTEKNETDTELALDWCLKQQCYREIIICNDMQGRFDHALAIAINLLKIKSPRGERISYPVPYRIESENQSIFILPDSIEFNNCQGKLLSLIPLSEKVVFSWSQNLKYPLNDLVIRDYQSRGISNIITASSAGIIKTEGICLAVLEG